MTVEWNAEQQAKKSEIFETFARFIPSGVHMYMTVCIHYYSYDTKGFPALGHSYRSYRQRMLSKYEMLTKKLCKFIKLLFSRILLMQLVVPNILSARLCSMPDVFVSKLW